MGVIGRYETHEQIGRGTMGIVYRARDTVLDRFVALKVLRTGRDLGPEIKERFYREAKFGARLQHPNLAIIYDLGEADNQPFIAMELLQGADLRTYIEEKRPVPLAQKIEFLAQVCDGIAHAHRQGVIHRDIKPSNIFIHEDRQAKVLDFGIARLPTSTLTVEGNVLGTPNYMCPEQIQSRPCDARSDLFSAAIVFYEFLVYAHPFRSTFIPRRIAVDSPDSLYDHDPDVPPGLEELIMQGLAKRPEERIQSAEEFGNGLRHILDLIRSRRSSEKFTPLPRPSSGASTPPPPPLAATPAEDDSRGRRVSEFMALSKDFDSTLPVGDLGAARAALDQMRKLAAADALLRSSFLEYEERFGQALRSAPPSAGPVEMPQARAAAASAASPRLAPNIGHPEDRPPAASQSQAKTEPFLSASQIFPEVDTRKAEESDPPRETRAQPGASKLTDDTPAPIAEHRANSPGSRDLNARLRGLWAPVLRVPPLYRWVLVLALCLGIVLPLIALWPSTKTPRLEPSIGTAFAIHPVNVAARPEISSKAIISLPAGARVNVLEHVNSKDQQWVRVQPVSSAGRANALPGYVRVADLTRWSSNDPRAAWEFLITVEPADGGTEQEIHTFANELVDFGVRFPVLAAEANLERARLYLLLAQRSKDRGQPAADRENDLQLARAALSQLPANLDPTQSELRTKLTNQTEALASPGQNSAESEKQQKIKALLSRIKSLWEQGDYPPALELVKQAQDLDPGNAVASYWKAKILEAIAIENGQKQQ